MKNSYFAAGTAAIKGMLSMLMIRQFQRSAAGGAGDAALRPQRRPSVDIRPVGRALQTWRRDRIARLRSFHDRLWQSIRAAKKHFFHKPRYTLLDLQPLDQLSLGAEPMTWHSTGSEPQFHLDCDIPRGWIWVNVRIDTPQSQPILLRFDTGNGFDSQEPIQIGTSGPNCEIAGYVRVKNSVRGIRLAPLVDEGEFQLTKFRIRASTSLRFYARAVWLFLAEARNQHEVCAEGVRLLWNRLQGKRAEVKARLIRRLTIRATTPYDIWLARHKLTSDTRQQMAATISGWQDAPKISVIMSVHNTPEPLLRSAIESVRGQVYPRWELCVADECSTAPHVRAVLEHYARLDHRIRVAFRSTQGPTSTATNTAIEMATGAFLAFLDHHDEYSEHALFRVAQEIIDHPEVDWIYSDEDKLNADGRRSDPFFKPDWSPEYLLSCMYTGHLAAYRTQLVREVGGLRSEYDSAQDYDLALRMMARTSQVRHIADVLYHRRASSGTTSLTAAAKPQALNAARRALENHLSATQTAARVEATTNRRFHRVRYAVRGTPLVSIVIATASRPIQMNGRSTWFALECVRSIRRRTTYKNLEIIIVDNNDMPAELSTALERHDVVRLHYTEPFNYSAKANLGASRAKGEYVIFLNDDIEILTPGWIEGMLEHAQRERVGAVGVQLLYPNGKIQHAGVVLFPFGADHIYRHHTPDGPSYGNVASLVRNPLAVTGACMMVSRRNLDLVGGWNESLPNNFNDIDLCLKLVEKGERVVYTPYVQLMHHESVSQTTESKKLERIKQEARSFTKLWREKFPHDPYYSVHLSHELPYYEVGPATSAENWQSDVRN